MLKITNSCWKAKFAEFSAGFSNDLQFPRHKIARLSTVCVTGLAADAAVVQRLELAL